MIPVNQDFDLTKFRGGWNYNLLCECAEPTSPYPFLDLNLAYNPTFNSNSDLFTQHLFAIRYKS